LRCDHIINRQYARLFDRTDMAQRVRAAQASITLSDQRFNS
jgi:hypothetical protein